MARFSRFSPMNRVTTCRLCKKRTHSSMQGMIGLDLCRSCLDECDQENTHNDYHSQKQPTKGCTYCDTEKAIQAANLETEWARRTSIRKSKTSRSR